MSWIANLDAKAQQWHPAARAAYRAVKWILIALGAYGLLGLMIQRANPAYWRNLWNL